MKSCFEVVIATTEIEAVEERQGEVEESTNIIKSCTKVAATTEVRGVEER